MLRDKQLLPVVCFVFSRKRCDDYLELVKGLDLNSQEDKHYVSQFFRQALARLSESDRQLQQVIFFYSNYLNFALDSLGYEHARNG
jgi:antiviral helicase SKI2